MTFKLINSNFTDPRLKTQDLRLRTTDYGLRTQDSGLRINFTYHFLKRKENEYNQIKKEWERISNNDSEIKKEGNYVKR